MTRTTKRWLSMPPWVPKDAIPLFDKMADELLTLSLWDIRMIKAAEKALPIFLTEFKRQECDKRKTERKKGTK